MLRRREADAARATAAPGHVGHVPGCRNPMKHGTKTVVFIAGKSARNGGLSWFIAGKIYGKSSNIIKLYGSKKGGFSGQPCLPEGIWLINSSPYEIW